MYERRIVITAMVLFGALMLVPVSRAAAQAPVVDAPPAEEAVTEPAATQEEATEEPKVEEPVAAKVETTAPEQTAAKKWKDVFGQWTALLTNLRDLRTEFEKVAEDDELDAIREKYDADVAQGRELLPKLRLASIEAFREAPDSDRGVTRLLVQFSTDALSADQYAQAAEIANLLIDADVAEPSLHNTAAIAAYSLDDFEGAEKHFQQARKIAPLDAKSNNFAFSIGEYKKLWEIEQQARKKEAEADDLPRVKLETSKGDILIELYENEAPNTVGNFVNLVEKGFYDGLTFHRVLDGFMAQGGCPKGDGTGDPGYSIYSEFKAENARKHFRGTLSMANSGPDSGGSQFFLTFLPTPHLNGRHTVFGRVIEGMDIAVSLQRRNPDGGGVLPKPDTIKKATVVRKRDHKYVPAKVD